MIYINEKFLLNMKIVWIGERGPKGNQGMKGGVGLPGR